MKTLHDVYFIDTNPIQSNPHKLPWTYIMLIETKFNQFLSPLYFVIRYYCIPHVHSQIQLLELMAYDLSKSIFTSLSPG
jgi:hypothetical protein